MTLRQPVHPRVLDLLEIERLVVEGFDAVDRGEADRGPQVTTDDFVFSISGRVFNASEYAENLKKRAAATYTTRHCATNFRVVDETNEGVTVRFTVNTYRLEADANTPVVIVADFVDVWVQIDQSWRHRARSITPVFAKAG